MNQGRRDVCNTTAVCYEGLVVVRFGLMVPLEEPAIPGTPGDPVSPLLDNQTDRGTDRQTDEYSVHPRRDIWSKQQHTINVSTDKYIS